MMLLSGLMVKLFELMVVMFRGVDSDVRIRFNEVGLGPVNF